MPIVFALLTSGCESIIAKTGVRSGVRQKEKELRNYHTSQAETILNKYGKINPDAPDEYILPYFICLKNLKSQENKVHDIIRKVNRGLGKISSALGIQKTTTYTARHTYASFAQSRMTADQIQKFLGHTNSRTTQIYMSSLQQDVKDINRNMLEDIGNSH